MHFSSCVSKTQSAALSSGWSMLSMQKNGGLMSSMASMRFSSSSSVFPAVQSGGARPCEITETSVAARLLPVRAAGALKQCNGMLPIAARMIAEMIALNMTLSSAPTRSRLSSARASAKGNSVKRERISSSAANASSRVGFLGTSGNEAPSGSKKSPVASSYPGVYDPL
jgi:hypothetical protein